MVKDEDLKDWPGMPGYIKEGAVWHWGTGQVFSYFNFCPELGICMNMYLYVIIYI